MITLQRERVRLELAPEAGGSIVRLAVDDRDILRPAPPGSRDPLAMACFPLVPFANRIAQGAFRFAGREVRLPREEDGHALHGHGWRGAWTVNESKSDDVALGFLHPRGEWPWTYAAEQRFSLLENGLRIRLTLRNDDADEMPFSLGFHPYFLRTRATMLQTSTAGIWLGGDASGIEERAAFTGIAREISGLVETDHCHLGWNRRAVISMPVQDLSVELTADDTLSFLHVYAPSGEAFFCAEPVSAVPDAFNRSESSSATGMRTLHPSERATAWMELRVLQR